MVIPPHEIESLIHKKIPHAQTSIIEVGKSSIEGVFRYKISTSIEGVSLEFHIGENIIFYMDGHPATALKHVPISEKKQIVQFIQTCLDSYEKYLQKKELPIVKALARKYIGKELKIESHERARYIIYEHHKIIVTAFSIFLVERNTNRTVQYFELGETFDLDRIFNIIQLQIKQLETN